MTTLTPATAMHVRAADRAFVRGTDQLRLAEKEARRRGHTEAADHLKRVRQRLVNGDLLAEVLVWAMEGRI